MVQQGVVAGRSGVAAGVVSPTPLTPYTPLLCIIPIVYYTSLKTQYYSTYILSTYIKTIIKLSNILK